MVNFLAAAILGLVLRLIYLVEIPFVQFRPFLHAHSHVALLGWLFIAVVVAIWDDGGGGRLDVLFRQLLFGLQLAVVMMLFAFPLQGYGPISIAASMVHMLLAFAILYRLWQKASDWPAKGSRGLVRWAITFFCLSNLGVMAIPIIISAGLQANEIYYWSVQFFLHFQFNGWFWFAAMTLGARWAERRGVRLDIDGLTMGLWVVSATLTFALAIAWSEPRPMVFATVALAVALQVWAALRTLRLLRRSNAYSHTGVPRSVQVFIGVAFVSMALKVLVQALVAVPQVAVMALTIRHFVMGFIHLNTLGTMTMLVFAYALVQGWLDHSRVPTKIGSGLLVIGIVLSELMLFLQGSFFWSGWGMIPGHYLHLVIASGFIPIGILFLLYATLSPQPPRDASHMVGGQLP
jgi:hypothetical protein